MRSDGEHYRLATYLRTCVVMWCDVVFEEVAIEYRIQSLLLIHYSQKL